MGAAVVVRPDEVSLGVLVSAVPRDAVDAAVSLRGAGEALGRQAAGACDGVLDDGVVPVRPGRALGCADCQRDHQARKRLGRTVLRGVLQRTCGWVAGDASPVAGCWRWALPGIVAVRVAAAGDRQVRSRRARPPANAAEFGYTGSGANRSAYPRHRWWRWPSAVVSGRGCRGERRPRPARPPSLTR